MNPHFSAKMQTLLQEVYEAGYRDGGTAMRDAILKAAEVPVHTSHAAKPASAIQTQRKGERAPRGLLRQVIAQALRATPGLTELDIQDEVARLNSEVSPRSIGGELRRMRGEVYRQEGRRWFLLEGEAAGKSLDDPADMLG